MSAPADGPNEFPRITSIKRRPRGRALVTTSAGETLTVHAEALEGAAAKEGDLLDGRLRERLAYEEHRCVAHAAALRLLTHRPRSERELGQRLRLRGVPPEVAEEEVGRLRRAGLLDDEAFARMWVGERQTSAPRGQRLLRYELLGRGVRSEIADEAVASIDDRTAALALARRRAARLAGLEFRQFSRRLAGFLERRGFGYAEVEEAVRTVWNENAPESERR